ncbi:MAG: O-antigen ligase domain-containing protein [Chitinophagaceae bacterium]|nr:MAG: O-antigen ligase domain-containing protein [Chitinophagaceae bacterium]
MDTSSMRNNARLAISSETTFLLTALLFFFFNSLFLPQGLLYTDLLAPVFLWWLFKHYKLHLLIYFFIFTTPFILIHFYYNAEPYYYYRSYIMFFTAVVFAVCFYVSIKESYPLDTVFRKILIINFILFIIALGVFRYPELKKTFWYLKQISPGAASFPRLKLFTYEASYYSLLFAPVAVYFYLKLLLFKTKHAVLLFLMVTLPLLFSMSYGVIACIGITLFSLTCLQSKLFLRKKSVQRFLLFGILIAVIGVVTLLKADPGNPLFFRIRNIFTGRDTSFRGRTYESFILAMKILKEKSILFGVGLGQVKIIGVPVFKQYYGYQVPIVRIPNTLSDTMATYGIVGLVIRIFFTIFFFFKCKVWKNYYQLAMFIFMFTYQFTGSFMTNVVEYVIWVLAFTPSFKEFDRGNFLTRWTDYFRSSKKDSVYSELNPVE